MLNRHRLYVLIAYVVAIAAAAFSLEWLAEHDVWLQVLIADCIATAVIFGFSLGFRNSSFYDAYWSVAPVVIAAYLMLVFEVDLRGILLFVVVSLWGIRLTGNWLYGWQGLGHEDWRYDDLAEASGVLWWPLSFFGIHLFPTIIVFLGCLGMFHVYGENTAAPLGWLDGVALVVGLASIALELRADIELHRFRATRSDRQQLLTTGVWSWCRHPNYLGEIGFWISVYLFGAAAGGEWFGAMVSGPVAMLLLFVAVSIPMIEKKLARDKPGYAAYKAASFALLPLSQWRAGTAGGADS